MSAEDILLRLIEDVRELTHFYDTSDFHRVCGPECESCDLAERVREDLDEAENNLTRLKLGIGV